MYFIYLIISKERNWFLPKLSYYSELIKGMLIDKEKH